MQLPDKMTPDVLPDWPAEGKILPTQSDSQEPVICFRWEEVATHLDNFAGLEKICSKLMRSLAASGTTSAIPDLGEWDPNTFNKILQESVMDRVKGKYNQLACTVQAYCEQTAKTAVVGAGGAGNRGGDGDGENENGAVQDGEPRGNVDSGGVSKELIARMCSCMHLVCF